MTDDSGRHRDPTPDLSTSAVGSSAADLDPTPEVSTTLHEERLTTGTELHESGRVRVKKHVDTYPVQETVTRSVEHADDPERVAALEGDSGEVETLEDGSLSIPLFEEVLVVTKKLVVRERVIVRKRTVIDEHTLETELRREHVTITADDETLIEDRRTGQVGATGNTSQDVLDDGTTGGSTSTR